MKVVVTEFEDVYQIGLEAETVEEAALLSRLALTARQTEAANAETTFWGKSVMGWVRIQRAKVKRPEWIGGRKKQGGSP